MDRLWLLARDDERPTNPHPDHPLRVLGDLGGFDYGATHHGALLDLVEAELGKPGVEEHPNSPLLVVDTLLSREGSRSRAEGLTWTMTPYFVDPAYAVRLRDRIRVLLVEQALHGHPREASAAAKMFDDALRLPFGLFGVRVPSQVREAWKPDQEATLDAMEEVAEQSTDTAVRVEIRQALGWHAEHGPWSDLNERAAELIAKLSGDDDEILAAIAMPWGVFDEHQRIARDKGVAEKLLGRCRTGGELADYLEEILDQIISRRIADSPETGNVVRYVFESSLQHADEVWDWAVAHPNSKMVMAGSLALSELRRAGRDVDERLSDAAGSEEARLRLMAASYLCGGAWFESPTQTEFELLGAMSDDPDPLVRQTISTTVLRLRSQHPHMAVSIALRARIEPDDGRAADYLFSTISDYGVSKLGAEDAERMADQLVSVSDPEYFAHKLLGDLGHVDPHRVIDIWTRRLRREADEGPQRYRPVPFHDYGTEMLGSTTGEQRTELHATLLGALDGLDAWGRRQLGQIYWRLAVPGLPDDDYEDFIAGRAEQIDAALTAVDRHLADNPGSMQAVRDVLFELPWQVLLARPAWVDALLTDHDDAEEHLSSGLRAAAVGGMHGRTVGQDCPRWVAAAASAQGAGEQLAGGSPGTVFYADLAGYAQCQIENDRREDDQERDGWQ